MQKIYKDKLKICQRYTKVMPKIYQRYADDMPKMCQRCTKDMPYIYIKYIPKKCPRYVQASFCLQNLSSKEHTGGYSNP